MKTVINHAAAESFEVVKRTLYSFQVLIIGVLIPLLFIVGINTNLGRYHEQAKLPSANLTRRSLQKMR